MPGEQTSPTQPFVTKPPAFDRQGVSIDDLIDFTPELRAEAIQLVSKYELGPLFTVLNVVRVGQVHLFYRARLLSAQFNPGHETLEARLFTEDEIPWDDIAFRTVKETLEHFFADRRRGHCGPHLGGRARDRIGSEIDRDGNASFRGAVTAAEFNASGADLAEMFRVEGDIAEYEPGDVLVVSERSDRRVERSDRAYSTRVVGVYATRPGIILSEGPSGGAEEVIPVGVIGVIPTAKPTR